MSKEKRPEIEYFDMRILAPSKKVTTRNQVRHLEQYADHLESRIAELEKQRAEGVKLLERANEYFIDHTKGLNCDIDNYLNSIKE